MYFINPNLYVIFSLNGEKCGLETENYETVEFDGRN